MLLSTWLLYVAAVLVLTVTPGPSVFICVSKSVQAGPRQAAWVALGSTSAIVGIMALSAFGLGALLAASETLFTALKWLGAGYLAYLGVLALLAPATDFAPTASDESNAANATDGSVANQEPKRQLFMTGFWVGASNPKALLFFGALFPQFINANAAQGPQYLVLGATFVFFELLWLTVYITSAARAKTWLAQPRRALAFNRVTGVVFLTLAGLLATSKRST